MTKKETEFSKYAQAFFEIIDGAKSGKALFVKDLLKIGLTDEDKDYLDDTFPSVTTSKGKKSIEKNKADQLRKYLRGDNDISDIVSQLETEFDEEFRERYCEELQDYDDSRIMAFAQVLNIDVSEDDIDIVSEAIAEYYTSIVIGSAIKKKTKSKTSKDSTKTGSNSIALSYTITETEKTALIKLCELIKPTLRKLKQQTDIICNKQHELNKLTTSEEDERWKPHLEFEIITSEKRFNKEFPKLEKLCTDLVKLLKPKTDMDTEFPKLILFADNIRNDEYKITCPNEFKYNPFKLMISNFNDCIERTLRVIDKL